MFILSKPVGNDPIPPAMLVYIAQKLKNDFYHVVMAAFKDSGITQAELGIRLGKDKGQLHRELSGPSNWTIETVAKLLFAINGYLVKPTTFDIDLQANANMTQPNWLSNTKPVKASPGTSMSELQLNYNYGTSRTSSQPKVTDLKVLEEEHA